MLSGINLLTIFATGLFTGGLTCIAVQGGLMAATLSQDKQVIKGKLNLFPVLAFTISRLVAYTILGFLLGWAGSFIGVSVQVRIILQFLVVIFMLGTALNLLNVHPFFEIFMIKPPLILSNPVYKNLNNKKFFGPAILGFLTVFIPCGATQAMMALAVSSGNALSGSVILFTFILGTTPLFLILGFMSVKLGALLKKQFLKIAAVVLIFLALFNLDATLALANSPTTIKSVLQKGYCVLSYCTDFNQLTPVAQQTITFTQNGYTPNIFAVSKGTKVTLHLVNKNATGCIQAFTLSALNIQKIVSPNQSADISFVAPDRLGRITFTCSSGFYPGTIEVI